MQSDPHIGIDPPLKVLAWRDETGQVMIACNDPKVLASRHHIHNRDRAFAGMAGAPNKLTNAAIKKQPIDGDLLGPITSSPWSGLTAGQSGPHGRQRSLTNFRARGP